MQRVTRDELSYAAEVLAALNAKVEMIRQHFPPSIANLYARPRPGSDGILQWWTELGGQPLSYAQLNADQQRQLLDKYHERQGAIGHLADTLAARGQQDTAQALRGLIGAPDLANLYSVNGDPLIVRWGLPAPVMAPPAAAVRPAPVAPVVKRKVIWLRLWPWLLLLPLLLLLLWLLWFWRGYLWNLVQPAPNTAYACSTDAQTPDFVVVLDTSGSMNFNLNATPDDEEWMNTIGENLSELNPRRQRLLAEPTRLTVAKQAMQSMTTQLHNDIQTQLVTFDGCYNTFNRGSYSAPQRSQLLDEVQQLGAYGGTPLAASLQQAASMVDGRFKDAVVVMFADGEDGCGQNICEVAESIARQQPRLQVNVVNISDTALSNCVAQATGGKVFAARDSAALQGMLREAIEKVSNNPQCP